MAAKVFFFFFISLLPFFQTSANSHENDERAQDPELWRQWHLRPWFRPLKPGAYPPLPAGWLHRPLKPGALPPLPAGWLHRPVKPGAHPPLPAGWPHWHPHLPLRGGWYWPHPPLPSKHAKTTEEATVDPNMLGFWHHPYFPFRPIWGGARPPMPSLPPNFKWPFPHPPLPSWLPKFKWPPIPQHPQLPKTKWPFPLPPLPSGGSRWPWLPHHNSKGPQESKCSSTPAAVQSCLKEGTFGFSDDKGYTFSAECCKVVAEIKDECSDVLYVPVIKSQCLIGA